MLRAGDAGTVVKLAGWVQRRRDHGGLIFVDLRDRSGIVQVVFNPESIDAEGFALAESLRSEYVVAVKGAVVRRMPGMENPAIATGEIEVVAQELEVLNTAATPPFPSIGESMWTRVSACATAIWTCAGRSFRKISLCATG